MELQYLSFKSCKPFSKFYIFKYILKYVLKYVNYALR